MIDVLNWTLEHWFWTLVLVACACAIASSVPTKKS